MQKNDRLPLNASAYQQMYATSINQPEEFWAAQAQQFIDWEQPWQSVMSGNFTQANVRWFNQAQLNVCYNCVDRHLPIRADQTAIIWEGNEANSTCSLTYQQLYEQVCKFANVLKKHGVHKGDRVAIYLPMIPEAAIAMLACARIGAIHSVIFGGFSSEALKNRILDAECKIVITANESLRGNKVIPLKSNVDAIMAACPHITAVMVVQHTKNKTNWYVGRDYWYHEEMQMADAECPCEIMDANDPLFILYTSGSTGKPKGILHSTAGYIVYVAATFHYIFTYQAPEVFWCTADVGWITGHSYVIYGPLCNGATTLMFEGIPNYPNPSRYWHIIDKYQVSIFYTSPTAIRALRQEGDQWLATSQRTSLRLLGSVGEPINPEVWQWYYEIVGNNQCPIVDTWWQTETGGILISPFPHATPLKPGAAAWPFFGIKTAIVNEKGEHLSTEENGKLVITQPWPGLMLSIYGDHERFIENYFTDYPGNYLTGDNAHYDKEGDVWILGRNDDVIKVSGHRIDSAEVENAILSVKEVAEAAVVGVPHAIKGEAMYGFVTLKNSSTASDDLKHAINQAVRVQIGAIANVDYLQWTNALPKTRSGKIMRRLLRKIAAGETQNLGDTSTLTDPTIIENLLSQRVN